MIFEWMNETEWLIMDLELEVKLGILLDLIVYNRVQVHIIERHS